MLALYTLTFSYLSLMNFSLLMITCLDACIIIDLYYTLRNSFESPRNRTPWYYAISFTYSLMGTNLIAFAGNF